MVVVDVCPQLARAELLYRRRYRPHALLFRRSHARHNSLLICLADTQDTHTHTHTHNRLTALCPGLFIHLLDNKGPKATYELQNTIHNNHSPRQCIQQAYVEKT